MKASLLFARTACNPRTLLPSITLLATALVTGCGARSSLLGDDRDGRGGDGVAGGGIGGSAAEGGGGPNPEDPDLECPASCKDEQCDPPVLFDGPTVWAGVDGPYLYYATALENGANSLFRTRICGGTAPERLLDAEEFGGPAAFVGSHIFVPVVQPGALVRMNKDGSDPNTLHPYADVNAEKPRAVISDGTKLFITVYTFDGGMNVYETNPTGDAFLFLEGGLGDPDWAQAPFFTPNVPLFDDDYLYFPNRYGIDRIKKHTGESNPYTDVTVSGNLARQGGYFFFSNDDLGLLRVPDSGDPGDPELVNEESFDSKLVFDGDTLYATENTWDGRSWLARLEPPYADGDLVFKSETAWIRDFFLTKYSIYLRTQDRVVRLAR
ncbi:MAG: hypothetical protein U0271_08460 [Polyangiaceae bacterium]